MVWSMKVIGPVKVEHCLSDFTDGNSFGYILRCGILVKYLKLLAHVGGPTRQKLAELYT